MANIHTTDPEAPRAIRRLLVSPVVLLSILSALDGRRRWVCVGLPTDVRVVGADWDAARDAFSLTLESNEGFRPLVKDGDEIPLLSPLRLEEILGDEREYEQRVLLLEVLSRLGTRVEGDDARAEHLLHLPEKWKARAQAAVKLPVVPAPKVARSLGEIMASIRSAEETSEAEWRAAIARAHAELAAERGVLAGAVRDGQWVPA